MQSLPLETGPIHPKLHEPRVLDLGHVDGSAIWSPETEIAGSVPQDVDLLEDLAGGRHLHDGPFPIAGDVEIAVDVAAHPVEAVVRKFFEEPLVRQRAVRRNGERPNLALDA